MKDRVPTYPGRVKLTPVSGQANTYDMERADAPVQEGTPLNKANLLTDETAAKIWPDSATRPSNPSVNDALDKIASTSAFAVGDMLQSVRTNLGDKWLLCDGSIYYDKTSELYSILKYHLKPTTVIRYGGSVIFPMFNGDFFVRLDYPNFGVLHVETGELTTFTAPSGSGTVSNVEWDGNKWVLCSQTGTYEIALYTSQDLRTWTLAKKHTVNYEMNFSGTYAKTRFMFDGVAFWLVCTYSGYASGIRCTISADLQTLMDQRTTFKDAVLSCADGLTVLSCNNTTYIFSPGSTIPKLTVNTEDGAIYCVVMLGEDDYALVPGPNSCQYIYRYKKSSNVLATFNIGSLSGASGFYVSRMLYDKNTMEYIFSISYSSQYYEVRIHKDADWNESGNYTKTGLTSNVYYITVWSEPTNDWIYGGMASGYTLLGNLKVLPECSDDVYYTYIKAKE